MTLSPPGFARRLAAALAGLLVLAASPARADEALSDDKRAALQDFSVAYGIAELWPQFTGKVAQDSLPRLRQAAAADIAADPLATPEARDRAQARLDTLVPAARHDLEHALQSLDADELASYTAFHIYARYFETEEIRAMARFFGSPTGRKLAAESPAILAETRDPAASHDVMTRHFTEDELREIAAFWQSPVGRKMAATAADVREDMHRHFLERSEPAVQALARRVADQAEDAAAPPAAAPAAEEPAASSVR